MHPSQEWSVCVRDCRQTLSLSSLKLHGDNCNLHLFILRKRKSKIYTCCVYFLFLVAMMWNARNKIALLLQLLLMLLLSVSHDLLSTSRLIMALSILGECGMHLFVDFHSIVYSHYSHAIEFFFASIFFQLSVETHSRQSARKPEKMKKDEKKCMLLRELNPISIFAERWFFAQVQLKPHLNEVLISVSIKSLYRNERNNPETQKNVEHAYSSDSERIDEQKHTQIQNNSFVYAAAQSEKRRRMLENVP